MKVPQIQDSASGRRAQGAGPAHREAFELVLSLGLADGLELGLDHGVVLLQQRRRPPHLGFGPFVTPQHRPHPLHPEISDKFGDSCLKWRTEQDPAATSGNSA
jgi:hypothetical protein